MIKIESADSGVSMNLSVTGSEVNVMMLKAQIALMSSIHQEDMILLQGPPFKRIDLQVSIDFDTLSHVGQRIFLFNRRVYSSDDEGWSTMDVKLLPHHIPLPYSIEISKFSQKVLDSSSSPLVKALSDYENHFLSNLKRGECFVIAAEQSLNSCKKALEELKSQQDASNAAFSNLNDHFTSIKNEYFSSMERCERQQVEHKQLLSSFEENLSSLDKYELHPSLVLAYEIVHSGSAKLKTLKDCLPVEREVEWFKQCTTAHIKVDECLSQLKDIFNAIVISLENFERVAYGDSALGYEIKAMEDKIRLQQNGQTLLRDDYSYVSNRLDMIFGDDHAESGDGGIVVLLSELENRRIVQDAEFAHLEIRCEDVITSKKLFEQTKTDMNKKMYNFMRTLSTIQSEMQNNLKQRLKLLKKYSEGHNQYFQHLENVINFPRAYEKLLIELMRRKSFNRNFEHVIMAESNHIAKLRAEETNKREQFMSSYGINLPHIFFEMIPSLKSKPPYYSPSMTLELLPEISDTENNVELSIQTSDSMIFENGDLKFTHTEYQNLSSKVTELTKKIEILENNSSFIETNVCTVELIEKLLSNDDSVRSFDTFQLMQTFPNIANAINKGLKEKQINNDIEIQSNKSDDVNVNIDSIITSNAKISFCSFDINDIALFIPVSKGERYVAFHKNCPHRYLSEDSLIQILHDNARPNQQGRKPDYILGKIIFIETSISTEHHNPYCLELGTTYHAITVTPKIDSRCYK